MNVARLLWIFLLSGLLTAQVSSRPNFVVVLVDDHSYQAISAYDSWLKDYAQTPNIDRLAEEGMRFDSLTCNISLCSPSRAGILTGQFAHRNGVPIIPRGINEDSPQYPVELQKAGYQTWLVGKWHLRSQPKGYDKYMVVNNQGKYFDPVFRGTEGTWEKKGYATDVYTDIAMDFLENREKDKPFLLCLQPKAPHWYFDHAPRYDDLYADVTIPEPPSLYEDVLKGNSGLKKRHPTQWSFNMMHSPDDPTYYKRVEKAEAPNELWPYNPNNPQDIVRATYQQFIHKYIRSAKGNDDNLKRVLDYLDEEGLTEDTVVIYTSDQGLFIGEHGFIDKKLILDITARMPFLIRYPKLIKPGSINNELCMNIDLAPTLLDLAGVKVPGAMQGRSMVAMLQGKEAPADWRTSQFFASYREPTHYGIRTKRYTFAKVPGHPDELFDRLADPEQLSQVADKPAYKDVLIRLEAELQKQIRTLGIKHEELPTVEELR